MRALHVMEQPVPQRIAGFNRYWEEGENFVYFHRLEDAYAIAGITYCEITFEDGVAQQVKDYCISRVRCTCH